MPDQEDYSQKLRRYLVDAAFAFVATVVLALVIASFAASGVITMTLAITFLAAAFIVALGSTFFLDHLFRPTWKQRGFIAVALLLFLLLTGSYEWSHYAPAPTADEIAVAVSKIAGAKDQLATPGISIECAKDILPRTLKAEDTIQVLWLFPTPIANGGSGLVTQFSKSGQDWKWPLEDRNSMFMDAYRCEITNYGSSPVIDFDMLLDITFFESVKVPGQSENTRSHGKIKLRRDWEIRIQKIDAGRDNSYKFDLINNQVDQFVHVMLPRTATARLLGAAPRIQLSLDGPEVGRKYPLMFGPNFMGLFGAQKN